MELVNACSNISRVITWQVRTALSWLDPVDLDGVAFVQMLDEIPEDLNTATDRRRHAKNEGFSLNGLYFEKQEDAPAHIVIFVREIYRAIPAIFKWTTVPTIIIGRTLAHELAHHVIAKGEFVFQHNEHARQFEYEEEIANRYAFEVLKQMKARWHYKLAFWLLKRIAAFHYVLGLADWKERKYEKAAERWYRAWLLDPDRQDAVDWYWHAKAFVASGRQNKI